jgi:hypothetical protein
VMQAWMVMVQPGGFFRYTDSIWISFDSAKRRAEQLVEEFLRRGKARKDDWAAWTSPCQIEDAALPDPEKTSETEEEKP